MVEVKEQEDSHYAIVVSHRFLRSFKHHQLFEYENSYLHINSRFFQGFVEILFLNFTENFKVFFYNEGQKLCGINAKNEEISKEINQITNIHV